MVGKPMGKKVSFALAVLTVLIIAAITILLIRQFRISADTVPTMQKNMTPEIAKTLFDKESAEYDRVNNEINSITMSTPDRENRLKILGAQRQMLADITISLLNYLNQYPAYSVLAKDHADLTPEAPTTSAEDTAAKSRTAYSIRVGNDSLVQLTPGQEQAKQIEQLQSVFSQQWDQAQKVYTVFGQDSTNPARIDAPLKMFADAMAPFLKDGVLPPEILANLKNNFLSSDGINMETSLMISKDTAVHFFNSLLGIADPSFNREQFGLEIQSYITNGEPYRLSDAKFTQEQIDLIIQAMYPDYASAVAIYQEQAKMISAYSDEIKIGWLASFMSHGDSDRFQIIYNYLVEHKDAKMSDWLSSSTSIEKKMSDIDNYLKTNGIFSKSYKSSIGINSNTGRVEYSSVIKQKIGDNQYRSLGYISFDPVEGTFDAEVPIELGNKNVTLFSDPRTGDVWIEFGNADGSSLLGEGKVGLMAVTISKDGKLGGQFRLFNRLFAYNPNSGAFEIPIKLSNRAQLTLDTNGNIIGNIGIIGDVNSNTQGSLFFDRNGNMGITLDVRTATTSYGHVSTASIMYSKDGGVAGTVDLGKIIGGSNSSSFFLSFDKNGVSGVNVPIGSWAGKPFGLGVGGDGSLSFGGFVPIAGLPVPIGIGQDSSGGFRLSWPGGSLGIISGDTRPQDPPELKIDQKTGNYDASCVYYRHSFKKAFMTVRVYQVPCETIDRTEQIERGDMIMKVYSELLGRNPSIGEFLNWYFYSGHELYKYPDHNKKEYRMKATEEALRKVIKTGPYKNMSAQFKFPDKEEYDWIKSGKDPLAYPKRPKETLAKNPFADGSLIDQNQKDLNATFDDLIAAIKNDKQKDDGKIIDQTSVIQDDSDDNLITNDTESSEELESDTSGTTDTSSESSLRPPGRSSTATNSSDNTNNSSTSSNTDLEKKMVDPSTELADVPATNNLSKSREETVKNATTEINKIALTLEEKNLAEKMIEVAKQQVEAEKQIINLINQIESQNKIASFFVGTDTDVVDKINKAQIDNTVRNKTLSQISAKVSNNNSAEDIYTQNRQLEIANQELQKTVDQKQEQFSLFGWFVKLFNGIFN